MNDSHPKHNNFSLTNPLLLYSCGSDLIVDYIELADRNNFEIIQIVNNLEEFIPHSVSKYVTKNETLKNGTPFLVPLFTPYNKYLAVQEALSLGLKPALILNDRNNDLPKKFEHGVGCFINKRVVIGSESKIGNYVTINRGACLGHHIVLEDFVSIGPGVTTGGGVTIGKGSLIGTGATLLPEVKIGENAIIGAGSVVTKNIPNNALVMGNPAKQVSENKKPI